MNDLQALEASPGRAGTPTPLPDSLFRSLLIVCALVASWGTTFAQDAPGPIEPRLIVSQETAGIREKFSAQVEGLPTGTTVEWKSNDRVRIVEGGPSLQKVTLLAVLVGDASISATFQGRTLTATVKVVPVQGTGAVSGSKDAESPDERMVRKLAGLLRCKRTDPRMKIAALLRDLRGQVGGISAGEFMDAYSPKGSPLAETTDAAALRFFQELGRMQRDGTIPGGPQDPIPMLLVNEVKTRLLAYGGADFAAEFFGPGFPGKNGSPVEAALLGFRRKVTLEGIQHVAKTFKGQANFGRVFLAFVGSWVSQDVTDFTISGDIDFSFVGGNRDLLIRMRDVFNKFILARTGMDMRSIDSLCTAHGDATPDVYVGDAGRKYGDDAIVASMVAEFDLKNGTIDPHNLSVDGYTAVYQSLIEKGIRNYMSDPRWASMEDAIAAENQKIHVEPALSFEMVRHLEHDIIANAERIPIVELIVKGCKYLERSNSYTNGEFAAHACDPAMAQFADQLLAMKKAKAGPAAMATVIEQFFKARPEFKSMFGMDFSPGADGKPVAILRSNQTVAMEFLSACRGEMWKNVSLGLDRRLADLGKKRKTLDDLAAKEGDSMRVRSTEAGFRAELDKVLKGLVSELKVCGEFHVVIPTQVQEQVRTLLDLAKSFESAGTRVKLTPEQEKQLELIKRLLDGGAHQPHSLKMAAALAMDLGNKLIETTNARLDWLDDTLLGPLRGEADFQSWMEQAKEFQKFQSDPATARSPGTRAKATEMKNSLYKRYKASVVDLEISLNTAIYKNSVARGVTKINVTMNEFIQGHESTRAGMKGLMAFNLATEMSSYVESYSRDGFSGLAAEIIRRRVPLGSAIEAGYNGRYYRATWDTITTIFPPLALPEAALGVATYAATSIHGAWWSSELDAFINDLYAASTFDTDKDPRFADAKPPRFVLVSIKYRKKDFTKEALLRGDEFLLDPEADLVLWANLAQSDPFLDLMAELQNHPSAGPKVRAHFTRQYEDRWMQLKKEFMAKTIEALEKRRQGQEAVDLGLVTRTQDELVGILDELGIRDRVFAEMDREIDSNLGALWTWLKNTGRTTVWGGSLSETQANQMARILIKYRDAYKAILGARTTAEAAVQKTSGTTEPYQHTLRILTGVPFLTGKIEPDTMAAARWSALPGVLNEAVTEELLEVKQEYVPGATLDAGEDKAAVAAIFFEDVWIRVLRTAEVPGISKASFMQALAGREAKRTELLNAFRARYATGSGSFRLTVLHRLGTTAEQIRAGLPETAPVINAKARLIDSKGKEHPLPPQNRGIYQVGGLAPGAYTLRVSASGLTTEAGAEEHEQSVTVSKPDSGVKQADEATVFLVGKGGPEDALAIQIDRTPVDQPIRSTGENSTAVFTAVVSPKPDSGIIRYQWVAGGDPLSSGPNRDTLVFSGQGHGGETVKLTVIAIDEKGREGTASVEFKVVEASDIPVGLKEHRRRIFRDQGETLALIHLGPDPAAVGELRYFWTVEDSDGKVLHKDQVSSARTFNVVGAQYPGKRLVISVVMLTTEGRKGAATTTIDVIDKDAPTTLAMTLTPARSTIAGNGSIDLTAEAAGLPDSGEIQYSWDDGKTWGARTSGRVNGEGESGVTFSISVLARDQQGRYGSATATVLVRRSDSTAGATPEDKGPAKPDSGKPTGVTPDTATGATATTGTPSTGKLDLKLELKCDKPVMRLGDTAYLTASYTADNYVRSRLKWVWSPDLGSRDSATFKAQEPAAEQTISVRAFLPIQGRDTEVASGSVKITVLELIKIKAPREVLASDIFDASVEIPATMKGRYSNLSWSGWTVFDAALNEIGSYKPTDLTAVKIQIPPRPRDHEAKADGGLTAPQYSVGVRLLDGAGQAVDETSQPIVVKPAMIGSTGPDIWKGGSHSAGFEVSRTEAVRMRQEKTGPTKSAVVSGRLSVKWSESISIPVTDDELRKNVEGAAIWRTLPPGNASEGKIAVVPFSIGDFKGYMKKTTQVVTRYNGNPWGYVDVGLPQAGVAGYAEVRKGKVVIVVNYSAGGSGMALGEKTPWWDDMPFLKAQTTAADAEIQAMLGALNISADGRFDTFPYDGPKLDGSDTAQVLSVDLTGPDKPIGTGQAAAIKATVQGGKPPYTYTWTGDHAGAGSEVTFIASKAGEHKLSLRVTDSTNNAASRDITIKVQGVTGQIVGLRGQVIYGEQVRITGAIEGVAGAQDAINKANAMNAKSQAEWDQMIQEGIEAEKEGGGFILPVDEEGPVTVESPTFKFIWHSDTEGIAFDPPEGTYATVTFGRMGDVKIWAQVVDGKTGATIGETPQQSVKIVAPKFHISFEPLAGKVGQEIRARVVTEPITLHAPLFYRWSTPESSNRMEYDAPASQIGFKLKNAKPYRITALVEVPYYRDAVENIDATFTPGAYAVKASIIENETTKPKVWDPVKGGVISLPRGTFAGDERIQLRAELIGEPKPDEVRWHWTVNEGSTISNDISQTPTVSRHETGSIVATVTASDKDGVVLGTDTLNIPVTVVPAPPGGFLVALQAQKTSLKSGESTVLQATVKGGVAPYAYQWSGVESSSPTAPFAAKKAGSQIVTVTVKDAKGKTAVASQTLAVEAVVLNIRLRADRPVCKIGDTVALASTTTGGTPPYTFTWASPAKGDGPKGTLAPLTRGAQEVRVEVADPFDNRGTATLSVQVEQARAEIVGQQVQEFQGATRVLTVVTDAPQPWQAVFHAEPAVTFTGVTGGKTTAAFTQGGNVVVWAEVVRQQGADTVTLARTKDYTVSVQPLKFSLTFQPEGGRVGEEVLASLVSEPAWGSSRADWNVEWSQPPGHRPFGRIAVKFTPQDMAPLAVAARVKDRSTGQILGEVKGTYSAKPVELTIRVETGKHHVGRPVLVKADWEGGAEVPQARLQWSVNNGSVREGAGGTEVTVVPASAGVCKITATARSAAGGPIGTGSASFEVLAGDGGGDVVKPTDVAQPGGTTKPGDMTTPGGDTKPGEVVKPGNTMPPGATQDPAMIAQGLVNEGYTLEKQGQLEAAIGKYESALKLISDAKLSQHVQELKVKLSNITKAQQLINEGYTLEKAGKLTEAVASYTQAYALFPDEGLSAKIASLKAALAGGPDPRFFLVDLVPVGGSKRYGEIAKDILIDSSSWVRLKELADKPVYQINVPVAYPVEARGIAIDTELDNAHSVQQGMVVARMTVIGAEGQQSFDIKAGIHTSEWNRGETGGADHLFPKASFIWSKHFLSVFALSRPLTVKSVRFDYVRLDRKYWHNGVTAHGFILQGLTLLRTGATITPTEPPEVTTADSPVTTHGQPITVTPEIASAAKPVHIEGNSGAVGNHPTAPSLFVANEPMLITHVSTYHWNFGKGTTPGTVALRHSDGTIYGPWQMTGQDGQGGVKGAVWVHQPNIIVKAGTYTIVDSEPSTWSQNAQSGGRGMCEVRGVPAKDVPADTPQPPEVAGGSPDELSYVVNLSPYGGKSATPSVVRGINIESSSYIRMKSTDEKRLTLEIPLGTSVAAQGVGLLACLDDSTNVKTGEVMTVVTVKTISGDKTFDLKAGVHAADWNYGEHNSQHASAEKALISRGNYYTRFDLPPGTVVTGVRFDYRKTNSPLWFGHAPGFVIKGLTIIRPAPATSNSPKK